MQNKEPNTLKKQRAYRIVSLFFLFSSVLGLILMVYGLCINDLKTAIPGAWLLLSFISFASRGHEKLEILNGFCLFVLAMLWYQVFSLNLMSIIILVAGIISVIATVYSIIRKRGTIAHHSHNIYKFHKHPM